MVGELKIIVGETSQSTHVLLDNQPVSWIQDIKIHANAEDSSVSVEITFPDLTYLPNGKISQEIANQSDLLRAFSPHVSIILKPIG